MMDGNSLRPLLVLGGSGQVGSRLLAAAGGTAIGTSRTRPTPGLLPASLEDPEAVQGLVREMRPRAVIVAAAFAWVGGCEKEPERARRINVDGPRAVAMACREVGAIPVLLSTDYVFDGTAGPYDELAPVHPISQYGLTKLQAEQAVCEASAESLIVRTNVVYSWDPAGQNFVMQLVRTLRAGLTMRVPVDQFNNPVYAPDLANCILELIARRQRGIFHLGGPDLMNRHELGLRIARAFGLPAAGLQPVTTPELKQPAARPLLSGLVSRRFEALVGRKMVGVEAGLACVLEESRGKVGTQSGFRR